MADDEEWTLEGKKIAAERAKPPAHDEMVRVLAGSFIMGSDKIDHNAYRPEFLSGASIWTPSRSISSKSQLGTVLKFVLATNRALIDWQYDGGNFQETMVSHLVMHVSC